MIVSILIALPVWAQSTPGGEPTENLQGATEKDTENKNLALQLLNLIESTTQESLETVQKTNKLNTKQFNDQVELESTELKNIDTEQKHKLLALQDDEHEQTQDLMAKLRESAVRQAEQFKEISKMDNDVTARVQNIKIVKNETLADTREQLEQLNARIRQIHETFKDVADERSQEAESTIRRVEQDVQRDLKLAQAEMDADITAVPNRLFLLASSVNNSLVKMSNEVVGGWQNTGWSARTGLANAIDDQSRLETEIRDKYSSLHQAKRSIATRLANLFKLIDSPETSIFGQLKQEMDTTAVGEEQAQSGADAMLAEMQSQIGEEGARLADGLDAYQKELLAQVQPEITAGKANAEAIRSAMNSTVDDLGSLLTQSQHTLAAAHTQADAIIKSTRGSQEVQSSALENIRADTQALLAGQRAVLAGLLHSTTEAAQQAATDLQSDAANKTQELREEILPHIDDVEAVTASNLEVADKSVGYAAKEEAAIQAHAAALREKERVEAAAVETAIPGVERQAASALQAEQQEVAALDRQAEDGKAAVLGATSAAQKRVADEADAAVQRTDASLREALASAESGLSHKLGGALSAIGGLTANAEDAARQASDGDQELHAAADRAGVRQARAEQRSRAIAANLEAALGGIASKLRAHESLASAQATSRARALDDAVAARVQEAEQAAAARLRGAVEQGDAELEKFEQSLLAKTQAQQQEASAFAAGSQQKVDALAAQASQLGFEAAQRQLAEKREAADLTTKAKSLRTAAVALQGLPARVEHAERAAAARAQADLDEHYGDAAAGLNASLRSMVADAAAQGRGGTAELSRAAAAAASKAQANVDREEREVERRAVGAGVAVYDAAQTLGRDRAAAAARGRTLDADVASLNRRVEADNRRTEAQDGDVDTVAQSLVQRELLTLEGVLRTMEAAKNRIVDNVNSTNADLERRARAYNAVAAAISTKFQRKVDSIQAAAATSAAQSAVSPSERQEMSAIETGTASLEGETQRELARLQTELGSARQLREATDAATERAAAEVREELQRSLAATTRALPAMRGDAAASLRTLDSEQKDRVTHVMASFDQREGKVDARLHALETELTAYEANVQRIRAWQQSAAQRAADWREGVDAKLHGLGGASLLETGDAVAELRREHVRLAAEHARLEAADDRLTERIARLAKLAKV